MNIKNKIKNYLIDATGIDLQISLKAHKANLPIYLTKLYDYVFVEILGKPVIFTILRDLNDCPPIPNIKSHLKVIERNFKGIPVLVFENRAPRKLTLLVKNKIPYVYLGKEIYLPFLMLKLNSIESSYNRIEQTNFKGLPQAILTHQLIHQDLDKQSLTQISQTLCAPKASISRALNQIEVHGLCNTNKVGNKKIYQFLVKNELWPLSYRLFVNPVMKFIEVERIPKDLTIIKSGITALSERTLLSDSDEMTFAAHISLANKLNLQPSSNTLIKVELWAWNPTTTAIDGISDPISTYFSLKNTDDERVAIARDEYLALVGLAPIQSKESD